MKPCNIGLGMPEDINEEEKEITEEEKEKIFLKYSKYFNDFFFGTPEQKD